MPLPAAVIVLLVPACTGEGGPEAGTTSPAATESQSASGLAAPDDGTNLGRSRVRSTPPPTEPPATSPEDRGAAEAVAALENYLDVLNELSSDTSMALSELESIAADDALEWATYTISAARDQGWTITGERTFDEVDVTRIQLDPAESESGYPAVHLDACLDSTAVDAFDEGGDSVLPSARQTRLTTHWTVWQIDATWVVTKTGFIGETAEATPCA